MYNMRVYLNWYQSVFFRSEMWNQYCLFAEMCEIKISIIEYLLLLLSVNQTLNQLVMILLRLHKYSLHYTQENMALIYFNFKILFWQQPIKY